MAMMTFLIEDREGLDIQKYVEFITTFYGLYFVII